MTTESSSGIASHALRAASRVAAVWPWTWRGMVLGLVVWVAISVYGIDRLDLVLLVIGSAAAGLLLLSTVVVLIGALTVRYLVRRSTNMTQAHFETAREDATGFSLSALDWVPLLQIEWDWAGANDSVRVSSEHGRLQERVTLARRGKRSGIIRRVSVQDAFRLARITQRFAEPYAFDVLPHTGGLRRMPLLTSLAGGDEVPHPMGVDDGDRVELRRYVPGDPARFIHWKVFGRTRQLMVRMPERALSKSRRTVAYLIAGPKDGASAAAARVAIDNDALGVEWRFGADGSSGATSDRQEALQKIVRSGDFAGHFEAGASGSGSPPPVTMLSAFVEQVDREGPAALVVFAPPSPGPWIDALRPIAARRAGQIRVVVGVDALTDTSEDRPVLRWLLRPRTHGSTTRQSIDDITTALHNIRCDLVLVDRRSGRVLSGAIGRTLRTRRAA